MTPNTDQLIARIRANDVDGVRALLSQAIDVDGRDEYGWTPLCAAAGAGFPQIVRALIDRGADLFATGNDQRTPYLIALAAGHVDAARMLGEAEKLGSLDNARRSSGLSEERPYCRAYPLATLRKFKEWRESDADRPEDAVAQPADDVVFVHRDLTVTRSIWAGEDVVFDAVTDEWREFCERELNYRPPDDLDLVMQMRAS
jgi:ankyrin repeat protein